MFTVQLYAVNNTLDIAVSFRFLLSSHIALRYHKGLFEPFARKKKEYRVLFIRGLWLKKYDSNTWGLHIVYRVDASSMFFWPLFNITASSFDLVPRKTI